MTARSEVCHVLSTFHPVVGGAQRATERLCAALVRRGADVLVLTRRLPGTPRCGRVRGVPVVRCGGVAAGKPGALLFILHALWLLAVRLRRWRTLHVQSLDAPMLVGLAARVLLGRRLVATIHGEAKIVRRSRTRAGRLRLRLMRRRVDRFTALTPHVRAELMAQGVPAERIELIPNGVDGGVFRPPSDEERRAARARLEIEDGRIVVLYVGRLIELKGLDLLLRAWAELDADLRELILIGDGPARARLEPLAGRLGLRRVRFLGERDDVRDCLRAADIFVLPSRTEGLSVALLEAMAVGLPVLVSALPGNAAVIRAEHNGLVAPVGDAAALARGLRRLAREPALRRRLGRAATATIASSYTLGVVAARHEALYRSLGHGGAHDARRPVAAGPRDAGRG